MAYRRTMCTCLDLTNSAVTKFTFTLFTVSYIPFLADLKTTQNGAQSKINMYYEQVCFIVTM